MIKYLHKAGHYLGTLLFTNKGAGQTIMKNSFWLLLAEGIPKGILFLITILIARNYSVADYGVFGFIFSVMTLIALIADFGLKNIVLRELVKDRSAAQSYFGSALSFKILLTGIACAAMIITSFFLDAEIRILSLLAGVAILLEGMIDYLRIAFRMSEQSQFEVVLKVSTTVILLCIVSFAIVLKLSLVFILLGYIAANLIGFLLSLRLLNQKIAYTINAPFIRRLMSESWPLFLGLLCTTAYAQIDLIIIKIFRGIEEAGLYQAAYKLLFGFQLIGVVHMAMFPRLASYYAQNNAAGYRGVMQAALVSSLLVLMPLGIATQMFHSEILSLIFGRQYAGASHALPLLIWSGVFAYINGFFAYTLIISGNQKLWLASVFCALAILVIVELILIPRMGFIGAAIASFVGEFIDLMIVLTAVYANRSTRRLFIQPRQ